MLINSLRLCRLEDRPEDVFGEAVVMSSFGWVSGALGSFCAIGSDGGVTLDDRLFGLDRTRRLEVIWPIA